MELTTFIYKIFQLYEQCHNDPTNEGCDAPHQPDTSSYIIQKKGNHYAIQLTRSPARHIEAATLIKTTKT